MLITASAAIACLAWSWTQKLTTEGHILHFVRRSLSSNPSLLVGKFLDCPYCVAGQLGALITIISVMADGWQGLNTALTIPVSITFVGILMKNAE